MIFMKKYLVFTRAGMIESLQFRLGMIVMVMGNLVYLTVIYFLWKAIYASASADSVNGMTFNETMIYLVLATALFNFMEMYIVWEMGRNIQTGKIVLDLLKPIKYRKLLFWNFAGYQLMQFFTTFIPTFVVVQIVSKGAIPFGGNLFLFLISVILALLINFNIDYIVGTICLFTESIWGINIMKQAIVLLFSGAMIPIPFFPEPLKTIVMYLPFSSIYNAPLNVLMNGNHNMNDIIITIGVQIVWLVALSVLSRLFWNKSVRQITVNGG